MPGRSNGLGDYRFGYNGMEMDNEVSGNGNSYTTEFRQYDPRLMRWKSLDPLMSMYPWQSPFVAFNNNPIFYTDPYGLEGEGPGDNKVTDNGDGTNRTEPEEGYTCSDELGSIYYDKNGEWQDASDGVPAEINGKRIVFQHGTSPSGDKTIDAVSPEKYVTDKYGARPYGWANYSFGGNRDKVLDWFKQAGTDDVPASALYTYAVGEGLDFVWGGYSYSLTADINSFDALGFDWAFSVIPKLKRLGFLRSDFNVGDEYTQEDRVNEKGELVPAAKFTSMETAIEAWTAFYTYIWQNTIQHGADLGYGQPTLDQAFFWSYTGFGHKYYKIDKNGSWDFNNLIPDMDLKSQNPSGPYSKAYRRYVTWKYIQLMGVFD